jgi:hypothetical protein
MPYIKNRRDFLEVHPREAENAGELNFALTSILCSYIHNKGPSYQTYNEVIGVLECAKQELYRRIVGKYEDQKIRENGDVFPDWLLGKTGRAAMELTPSRNAPPSPPVTDVFTRKEMPDGHVRYTPVALPQAEIVRLEEAFKRHPDQPHEFTDAEMYDPTRGGLAR